MKSPSSPSTGHFYRRRTLFNACLSFALFVVAADPVPASAADEIRHQRDGNVLFLNCKDIAGSLGYEFKLVVPHSLVTFCKTGKNASCLPVRFSAEDVRTGDGGIYLQVDILAAALRCSVVDDGAVISVKPTPRMSSRNASVIPAYNAKWPKGRGFGKGDTLPDIPLTDMAGNEVRFSEFLGKRFVLYCWASW